VRFLLFDKVIEAERGRRMTAVKLVNLMDAYFEAHYPKTPIMPATLIIEALAQVGGMLNSLNHDCAAEMVLMLVDGVQIIRQVIQGELMELEVTMMYDHPYGATMQGTAMIDGEVVVNAERIVFAHEITENPDKIAQNRERFKYQTGLDFLSEAK